jgi:aspartate carbamoyltransferase catalytic subunit
VPVINCGDGWGEHPTQVLTDLFTIYREKGTLDGLTFTLIGDMRMRTMHSMGYAMCQFDIEARFVGPPDMALSEEFQNDLRERNLQFREVETSEEAIVGADVIYMEPVVQPDYSKPRQEASADRGLTPAAYRVTREMLRDKGNSDVLVLHSLPRMDELPPEVDVTRHCGYWVEAANGVLVRMALLALVLGAVE